MSLKHLAFAAFSTVMLSTMLSSMPQGTNAIAQVQQQTQETTINLSANDLKSPYWLSIRTPNATKVQGQIKLNGKVIQSLNDQNTQINLSSYLSVGINEITITGNYYPAQASVTVELNGNNNNITQQTSGSGSLNQSLRVEVR